MRWVLLMTNNRIDGHTIRAQHLPELGLSLQLVPNSLEHGLLGGLNTISKACSQGVFKRSLHKQHRSITCMLSPSEIYTEARTLSSL